MAGWTAGDQQLPFPEQCHILSLEIPKDPTSLGVLLSPITAWTLPDHSAMSNISPMSLPTAWFWGFLPKGRATQHLPFCLGVMELKLLAAKGQGYPVSMSVLDK